MARTNLPQRPIGQEAIALTSLRPTGFIQLTDGQGTIFDARSAYGSIDVGENVEIIACDFSDVLIVKTLKPES